jgi:ABC-type lipoprotein release transport system permease subunit
MTFFTLLKRSLIYYWRTNIAVIFGVAVAVAVLAGALVVGDSVRASLRRLFLERLGKADVVISSTGFFREQLAVDLQNQAEFKEQGFDSACPLLTLVGAVSHEESRRRGTAIQVYGVDERFWAFHSVTDASVKVPREREVLLSESLAAELGAKAGDSLLLRIEKPSAIPLESLHGRKEDVGRTVRLTLRDKLASSSMGEFSLRPQQSAVRAIFVSLSLLQKELKQESRVNTILVSSKDSAVEPTRPAALEALLRKSFNIEDLGLRARKLDGGRGISLETDSAIVNEHLAATARDAAAKSGMVAAPIFSYLANTIRAGSREIPYSLVTAVDEASFEKLRRGVATTARPESTELRASNSSLRPIVLNEWAARDLGVAQSLKMGEEISLDYYLWQEGGGLLTRSAQFRLEAIVPIAGLAADRDLIPAYPGITESEHLSDWDPPFPIDLSRVRQKDEDYWDDYRATPKAFISIEDGQRLWQTRFGKMTSMRVLSDDPSTNHFDQFVTRLRDTIEPSQVGLGVYAARAQGLEASRGATNFGEYFLYFSFFLVVSALLLAALFFRLGIEQRLRQIGTLQALGLPASLIRNLFAAEGAVLALVGSMLGLAGAYVYGSLIMLGLKTWWVGAVGTTALELRPSPASLAAGAAGGTVAAIVCVVWTLRRLTRYTTRSLLAGSAEAPARKRAREGAKIVRDATTKSASTSVRRRGRSTIFAVLFSLVAALLLLGAWAGFVGQVPGFFGGGSALLLALLCAQAAWLGRGATGMIRGSGWLPVSRLGVRNATHRPGRSVLCITLIAFAAFIIVAVDAFRRDDRAQTPDRKSGSGGYPLLAESVLPIVHNPNTDEGREALTLGTSAIEAAALNGVRLERFRVRPGDDASCLNLYQPRNPKIIAPPDRFLDEARFSFQSSVAESREEKGNPWLLLRRRFADGAIPVIADANSMTYVLHLGLGQDFVFEREGAPVRLRLVGALKDSVFQSELIMAEENFLRSFPEEEGARLFLLDVPSAEQAKALTGVLEERLADFGFDVTETSERLASFHKVENTFLSTFQTLGGLGLVLGTFGLAAVLLRNVLERRRELALLRAVGYRKGHFALMVMAENALLLLCGVLTGTASALFAVAPVVSARGGRLPVGSLGALLLAVIASGMIASLLATVAALRSPLLASLRAE